MGGVLRYHDIRAADDAAELRLRPWVATLSPPHRLLEFTFADAEEHGTTADALVDDDWSRCQRWAAALDVDGLVVPSAALPGTRNLILFGPKVRVRWGVIPPDAVLQVPCEPVADLGHGIRPAVRAMAGRRTRGAPSMAARPAPALASIRAR